MKLKLPKFVDIAGHKYRVQVVPSEKMMYGRQKAGVQILSSGPMGECEYPTRIIRINTNVQGELVPITFLHEIKHGHQFENGWTQIMNPAVMEMDCEQFVSLVSSLKKQGIL
jgi:hypothetical protein